jgi:hypothetical protein
LELHNSPTEIKKRRDLVSALHARSMTETEIAAALKQMGYSVDQATVSRDLRAIKEEVSQDFIFSLARSDLAYYYKCCLDTIEEVKRESWDLFNQAKEKKEDNNSSTSIRDKLAPLALIKECSESKFKLLLDGPHVLAINKLSERLENVEQSFEQQEANR